jgi:ParB-like chromosome segregation protein Spo0J
MNAPAFHPLADIFPLVEGAEFDELAADIKAHGLHEPIVLFEDKVLDGRNRLRACTAAAVEPTFTAYTGDDPIAYVVSLNLRRRHLNESQRAMVAAKLATLKDGQRADLVEGLPIGRASELLNVGERSVARAREVQEHGAPELVHAVERGKLSVSAAADIASEPIAEQREIVARGEREILQAAMQIRARKMEIRRVERIAKLAKLSGGSTQLPTGRRYPVILADPPWERPEGVSSDNRRIDNHYPMMPIEDICALPVAELATEAAVLFLWTTSPHLDQTFSVIEAWGFEYKTSICWVKDKIGIELFARKARLRWSCWGNEVGAETAPDDGIPDFLRRAPRAGI